MKNNQLNHENLVHSRASSSRKKKHALDSSKYIDKRKYGGTGYDDSDSNSEDERDPNIANKTPNTKRKLIDEKQKKSVEQLGTLATYMTLMKGFVCSSALYLPKSFINGGWGFSVICLIGAAFLTNLCASKVLKVRAVLEAKSYTDIGEKLYGPYGKLAVNISLALSQMGFTCAYVYFIIKNMHDIILEAADRDIKLGIWALICFVMWSLLAYVRKIQIFASTHVFADVMIVVTLVTCVIYGGINIHNEGSQLSTVPFI